MLELLTKFPVAATSNDHLHPFGTRQDNSKNPAFTGKLRAWLAGQNMPFTVLDLGCAGGGFVKEVLDYGGRAVGLEGSDYSQARRRAEWATIPDNLFTCDTTRPFVLSDGDVPVQFAAITGWEFLEHIAYGDIPCLFGNIQHHLLAGGAFIGSVSYIPCVIDGVVLHQTVQPESWWNERFADLGFYRDGPAEQYFAPDWIRVDATSFNVVLRRRRG